MLGVSVIVWWSALLTVGRVADLVLRPVVLLIGFK